MILTTNHAFQVCKKLLVRSIEFLLVDCSTVRFQCDNELNENMSLGIITPSQQMLNYLIKGLTATMVVSYLILVQLHSVMLPYESQSSYEVNDWAINRRGDYKRRQTNQKKANQRKRRNAYYGGRVQPQPDHKATERTKYQKRKTKIFVSQASVREIYHNVKDEAGEYLSKKAPAWWSYFREEWKVPLPSFPEDWDWKAMLWSAFEFLWSIKDTVLVSSIFVLLDYAVALEMIEPISWRYRGLVLHESQPVKAVSIKMVFAKLDEVRKYCYTRFQFWVANPTATWKQVFGVNEEHDLEVLFASVCREEPYIDIGKSVEDEQLYDTNLEKLRESYERMLKTCPKSERTYYSTRYERVQKMIGKRVNQRKQERRIAPYCLLFYGGSGVGKSEICAPINKWLLELNGFACADENIVTLNANDKFQSDYEAHHSGIVLDDLGNVRKDSKEDPSALLIQIKNSVAIPVLKAEVEKKGQVYWNNKTLVASTNNKTFGAEHTVEPFSRVGRFENVITMKVREDFALPNGKINQDLVDEKFEQRLFADIHEFTVQQPRTTSTTGHENSPGGVNSGKYTKKEETIYFEDVEFKGQTLNKVSVHDLLDFLEEDSKKYFENQRKMMKEHEDSKKNGFCHKCKRPIQCCKCTFESQAFEILESWKLALFALEEAIMTWLESLIGAQLLRRHGLGFLFLASWAGLKYWLFWVSLSWLACINVYSLTVDSWRSVLAFYVCIGGWALLLATTSLVALRIQYNKYKRLPRPSQWLAQLSPLTKARIWTTLGAIVAGWIVHKTYKAIKAGANALKSQMAPFKTPTLMPGEKPKRKEEHPFWGSKAISEKYDYKIKAPHKACTMKYEDFVKMLKVRQWFAVVNTENAIGGCNCVPLCSGVLVFPNHIIPKLQGKVQIQRPTANDVFITISKAKVKQVPNSDFALVYAPEIGDQRNLLEYMIDYKYTTEKVPLEIILNNAGMVRIYEKLLAEFHETNTTAAGWQDTLRCTLPHETFVGMCGATAVGKKGESKFIAGFHIAGSGRTGAVGIAQKSAFVAALSDLANMPGVLIPSEWKKFDTEIEGVSVGPLTDPSPLCPTQVMESDARMEVIGQHSLPRGTPSSHVVTTIISPKVTEIMKIEKIHGPPPELNAPRHKIKDMTNKTHTAWNFDDECAEKAYKDYFNQILKLVPQEVLAQKLHKLDDINVVSGADAISSINSMELGTAIGYPHKGIKRRLVKELDREVEGVSCPRVFDKKTMAFANELQRILNSGERGNTVFKGSLKDEPTKLTKDKARVFAGSNVSMTVVTRRNLLTFCKLVQDHPDAFESAVGVDVHSPDWTRIAKDVTKYGGDNMIAGDFKSFDGKMSVRFMLMAFRIIVDLCELSGNYDEEDLVGLRGIATEICYPVYDYFGTLVKFTGSNPSGHPLTVIINSMVNSMYMRYVYYKIAKEDGWWKTPAFSDVVALRTYGDDNLMGVKKGYKEINHTRFSKTFEQSEIEYTMAVKDEESKPYIKFNETSFLKHYFVWDSELGLYRAQIEEDSIAKMLHAHVLSKVLTPEEHATEAIINVNNKRFDFGREKYEESRKQLMKVAEECGLAGYVGELPSYDAKLAAYRKKFDLDP